MEAQAQVRQVLVPCAHSEDVMGGWERASYQERKKGEARSAEKPTERRCRRP